MSSPLIKFDSVEKSFGDIKALPRISFEIKKGEFVFVSGPSGSGKTTILKLLLKELLPSSGKIEFDGEDISKIRNSALPFYRRKIGVVFQDFRLLAERTIKENIETALAVNGVPQKDWGERVSEILSLVGLGDRAELFPSQLSGGELQRVSLARALVCDPEVIFADEPTGNLDWDTAEQIMDLIAKINKEGKTVVVASHHQSIIDKLGKRVIDLGKNKPKKKEEKKK